MSASSSTANEVDALEDEVEDQEQCGGSVQYLHSLGKNSRAGKEDATIAGRTARTSSTGRTSLTSSTGRTSTTATTSSSLLDSYNARYEGSFDDDEEDEFEELVPALAARSYHLPGYSFCQDYFQFFANTHPLFSICCHHPLHPVQWPMRMLQLAGSIVFGLLVTNMIWLFLVYDDERDADRVIVTISLGGNDDPNNITAVAWEDIVSTNGNTGNITSIGADSSEGSTVEVTEGMIFLWTVGGVTHALYDNTIYYITACVCCMPGRALSSLRRYRNILIMFIVVTVAALSSFLVVFRATLSDNKDTNIDDLKSAGFSDDQVEPLRGFEDKSSFEFLLSYGVEITMALLLWYPMVGTVLFVGILGCGRVPVLGGRPYEVKQEQLRREKRRKRRLRKERKAARKSQKSSKSGSKKVSLSTLLESDNETGRSRREHVLMSLPPKELTVEEEPYEEEEEREHPERASRSASSKRSRNSRSRNFEDDVEDDDDCPMEDFGLDDLEAPADEPPEQAPQARSSRKGRKERKKKGLVRHDC